MVQSVRFSIIRQRAVWRRKGDVQAGLLPGEDHSLNIAEILVSKLGDFVNAWVVEASTFHEPFTVFMEFVLTVNSRGEPKHYDPDGFPASSSIVRIISKSINQSIRIVIDDLWSYHNHCEGSLDSVLTATQRMSFWGDEFEAWDWDVSDTTLHEFRGGRGLSGRCVS
ncbi:hypothetical protein KSP39_PZI013963 [Platanthera zijinensis]|uniref:Uncharacterized protein n=1 Tax=Platanthera zijinensis TaxID=2320716 RepID=A0AAP0G2Y7_9ASPA